MSREQDATALVTTLRRDPRARAFATRLLRRGIPELESYDESAQPIVETLLVVAAQLADLLEAVPDAAAHYEAMALLHATDG